MPRLFVVAAGAAVPVLLATPFPASAVAIVVFVEFDAAVMKTLVGIGRGAPAAVFEVTGLVSYIRPVAPVG